MQSLHAIRVHRRIPGRHVQPARVDFGEVSQQDGGGGEISREEHRSDEKHPYDFNFIVLVRRRR